MAIDSPAASEASLPDYIKAAKPNPPSNRAAWYLNTAPTYAGIFLWFVFWNEIPYHGELFRGGLGIALLGVLLGGVICHFLFYLVPGLFGMKTGLPLYIIGTSTFGTVGGLLMPGFLMGLLQFGWLAVNAYFSSEALAGSNTEPLFYILCVAWTAGAAFVGLKGIQYVAKVATFLPLIPLAVLILGLVKFGGSAGEYQPPPTSDSGPTALLALLAMAGQIVGFFATAGAAGVDFGMNNRDARDVQLGGLVGILIATLFTAGAAVLIIAGAHAQHVFAETNQAAYTATNSLKASLEPGLYKAIMIGLTLAAFPGACFSSFIAANSFKTVMPKVNSFLSVGLGALVSIVLAVTHLARDLPSVFILIGASFGPICGAMCADYLLAGKRWAGPRSGFNIAGWAAWLIGFIVGILPNFKIDVPAAPVAAFIVGFIVYVVLAKAGMESPVVPYAPAAEQQAG
jgi:cytosine permease